MFDVWCGVWCVMGDVICDVLYGMRCDVIWCLWFGMCDMWYYVWFYMWYDVWCDVLCDVWYVIYYMWCVMWCGVWCMMWTWKWCDVWYNVMCDVWHDVWCMLYPQPVYRVMRYILMSYPHSLRTIWVTEQNTYNHNFIWHLHGGSRLSCRNNLAICLDSTSNAKSNKE